MGSGVEGCLPVGEAKQGSGAKGTAQMLHKVHVV